MRNILLKAFRALRARPTQTGQCLRSSRNSLNERARTSGSAQSLHQAGRCGSCTAANLRFTHSTNAFYDLERFGLRFRPSPRHADVLLVTGPVTTEHARSTRKHLGCHARSEMGGCGRRLPRDGGMFAGPVMLLSAASRRSSPSISTFAGVPRSRPSCFKG